MGERLSSGDADLIEAITGHVERTLGPVELVFHERTSPHVHLDVLAIAPSGERPFRTLVTCGMSERPMPDAPDPSVRFAELFVCLPPDWPVGEHATDETVWWPVRMLKGLARLPHEHGSWLWRGHTVENGDPPEPYAPSTQLCGALIAPPILLPDAFARLERGDDADIPFFAVLPLHADEIAFKLDQGLDALYDRFEDAEVDIVVDPARPSVVSPPRRRLFGLR